LLKGIKSIYGKFIEANKWPVRLAMCALIWSTWCSKRFWHAFYCI